MRLPEWVEKAALEDFAKRRGFFPDEFTRRDTMYSRELDLFKAGAQAVLERCKVLEEALEFYANPPNSMSIDRDFYKFVVEEGDLWKGGGDRAKAALTQWRSSQNGNGG